MRRAIISEPYQQILALFTHERGNGLRAKDVCLALGIGTEPKDTAGIRAKLKGLSQPANLERDPARPPYPRR